MIWDPLVGTAALIGSLHTLAGPDHYVPFIALGRARSWPLARCLWITLLCGLGHIAGSVLLGLVGLGVGVHLERMNLFEQLRGNLAGWFLMLFGLLYLFWGLYRAATVKARIAHTEERNIKAPWVLFIAFVLGPCEPLIPLLMAPAFQGGWPRVVMVVAVFSITTLAMMLAAVTLGYFGLARLRATWLQRYAHAMAGMAVFSCGLAVLLGL